MARRSCENWGYPHCHGLWERRWNSVSRWLRSIVLSCKGTKQICTTGIPFSKVLVLLTAFTSWCFVPGFRGCILTFCWTMTIVWRRIETVTKMYSQKWVHFFYLPFYRGMSQARLVFVFNTSEHHMPCTPCDVWDANEFSQFLLDLWSSAVSTCLHHIGLSLFILYSSPKQFWPEQVTLLRVY